MAELTQVRRQRQEWQRTATQAVASGRTPEALSAYQDKNAIVAVEQRGDARTALLARWARDAKAEPAGSQLVLAYTRDDVNALNTAVRTLRQQTGKLGQTQVIATAQGEKEFAVHDRIRFGRNEKTLGVKNGSLGTVERIEGGVLQVRLDGTGDTRVAVDTEFYKYLDHGYAATVHKAQGTTVDRTYVLATPNFDRHTTYVALSRHRESATVFYAAEDFGGRDGRLTADQVQAPFVDRLSRVQAKDLAHDYLEAAPDVGAQPAAKPTLEEIRRAGREQWRQERELAKQSGQAPSLEEIRRQGREDWLKLRAELAREQSPAPGRSADRGAEHAPSLEPEAAPRPVASTSSDPTLEQILAQGRAANLQVAQALERERLQAQEREAALEKERSRGRGRGLGRFPGDDDRGLGR